MIYYSAWLSHYMLSMSVKLVQQCFREMGEKACSYLEDMSESILKAFVNYDSAQIESPLHRSEDTPVKMLLTLLWFFSSHLLRSSGSGELYGPLTKQTGPSSYSLSQVHLKFPCRASLPSRAWTASRSSRFTVTIVPLTACHLLIPGTDPALFPN